MEKVGKFGVSVASFFPPRKYSLILHASRLSPKMEEFLRPKVIHLRDSRGEGELQKRCA